MTKKFDAEYWLYPNGLEEGKEVIVKEKGEMLDSEWQILENFQSEATQMLELEPIKSMRTSLSIKFKKDRGFSDNSKLPSENDLSLMLHKLRPFILQKEPYNFFKVLNIMRKNLKHSETQDALVGIKDLFSGKCFREEVVQFKYNNDIVNSEEVLNLWLNSFEYHRDEDKKEFFIKMNEMLPSNITKGIFVHMLVDKAKAIKHLTNMVKITLGIINAVS